MEDEFLRIDDKQDSIIMFGSHVFRIDSFISAVNDAIRSSNQDGFLLYLKRLLNQKLLGDISVMLSGKYTSSNFNKWLETGMDCEILHPNGKGWQKGKARIRVILEFCPDEADEDAIAQRSRNEIAPSNSNHRCLDSSLDDIRQEIANKSQNGQV